MNFWERIKKERGRIIGLAPMDGVTDGAFRWMVAKYGQPDVMLTEFVNVEGLSRGRVAQLLPAFLYHEIERPIVAQLFGKTAEDFYRATVMVASLGFDGVDINMGCPAKNVAEKGAGGGLIKQPQLAQEIVRQVKAAVKDWQEGRVDLAGVAANKEWLAVVREFRERLVKMGVRMGERRSLPVSVKTRLGAEKDVSEWWMEVLVEVGPEAISVHGRTLQQMYQGKADWEAIGRAGEVVRKQGIIFLGNGDVKSVEEAEAKIKEYGVDGVLIGRASLGNPGVFRRVKAGKRERLRWMSEHVKKYEELFGEERFWPMRKHLAWYGRGFAGAKELRMKLMRCQSRKEVEEVICYNA